MNQKMAIVSWDPLGNMDQEMLSASAKRSIKNILKSYVGVFDPLSELIQNSLDALDKREGIELVMGNGKTGYKKTLWLIIDLLENSITIIDNGIGFKEPEFKSFLAPSISFKDSKKSRGNKGVGATYIAYGFNHLELATKANGFQFSGEIKDGRNWVEDLEGRVARPTIQSKENNNDIFNKIDQGSYFKLRFGGMMTRPKDLSWYQASTAAQWLFLLLIKTPLGGINLIQKDEDRTTTIFNLKVIDKEGSESAINGEANYKFPHLDISASKDLAEVRNEQDKLRQKGADISRLPMKYKNLNGIYEFFDPNQIKQLLGNRFDEEDFKMIDEYCISAYGYFSYSTTIWDVLNDDVAKLRKGYRVLKGGIQLANNSMAQGDLLVIPLTKSIGYQNQTHVIIHLQDADPDLGRKGFQPELKVLSENIAIAIVNHLKAWRHLLKQDKGNKPDIIQEANLYEWVKHEEEFEKQHPLNINNPHFFKPTNEISISSEPQTEQDVIVLFSQLLAGGVIRSIKLLSTSQNNQYDGLFKFMVIPPEINHVYDFEKNPLGILIENYNPTTSIPKVLEYKYNLDALIFEFENNDKQEKDISLAIVWDIGVEWQKNYEILSLLDLDNIHHRQFHGITHSLFTPNGGRFDAIVLSELVQYLNYPEESAKIQKAKYSDN